MTAKTKNKLSRKELKDLIWDLGYDHQLLSTSGQETYDKIRIAAKDMNKLNSKELKDLIWDLGYDHQLLSTSGQETYGKIRIALAE